MRDHHGKSVTPVHAGLPNPRPLRRHARCDRRPATSGALDTRFGTAGGTLTPVTAGGGAFRAMAVQPDGKIVAVGERYKSGSEADLLLARFEANGALDASFGTGGVAVFDSQANAPTVVLETATAVALQADGKIVVAGVSRDLGDFVIVARLTATGTLGRPVRHQRHRARAGLSRIRRADRPRGNPTAASSWARPFATPRSRR
ncbi:MAG: hypothetical protein IPL06_03005 [Betaproteobacteria bacterium]|nr:hypothetical protein [Betaproteobacteria bacterium]